MKRFFSIIVVVFLLGSFQLFSKGSDIKVDKTDENGVRVIETTIELLYAKGVVINAAQSFFSLRAEVTPDTTYYYLIVMMDEGKFSTDKNNSIIMDDGHTLSMDKGRKLLLKLKNEIIELENCIQIDAQDCVEVETIIGPHYWVIKPQYPLSPDVIQKLLTENVEKLRFETNTSYFDRKTPKIPKFKKQFTKLYKALTERINTPTTIYDGF